MQICTPLPTVNQQDASVHWLVEQSAEGIAILVSAFIYKSEEIASHA